MIIKASQRGGAKALALHLLNDENEHVTVHELKGFVASDVVGAFKEMQAVAQGTQAKKFLFSLSLNPPANEVVSIEDFEQALERIEAELKLQEQPRCVILHEKQGRRHAHCVWSRIDGNEMKAINLPYFKKRLNGIAKALYLEHGWDLPQGFQSPALTDPLNFTLSEWQQAKRHNLDPREIKHALQQAWKLSDSKPSFCHALGDKGFFLSKGDKRGYVAVDWRGEVYSLSRATGIKTKDLKARLGQTDELPSVDETKAEIAKRYTELKQRFEKELRLKHAFTVQPLLEKRQTVRLQHRQARATLEREHVERSQQERAERQSKIRKGLLGFWDFITGKSYRQHQQNKQETEAALQRDLAEKERLVSEQLAERKQLHNQLKALRVKQQTEVQTLDQEMDTQLTELGVDVPAKPAQQRQSRSPTLSM